MHKAHGLFPTCACIAIHIKAALPLLSFDTPAEPEPCNMALRSNSGLGIDWKQLVIVILAGPVLYLIGWTFYARFLHPLAKIPGPLWPSVSRTWLMYRMYKGDLEVHMRVIHERYKIPA